MGRRLIFLVSMLLFAGGFRCEAGPVNFRWTGYATNALSAPLISGSLVITYISPDPTVNWSGNWSDNTDGGHYGARGNDFVFPEWARGTTSEGSYITGAMATNNYSGYYVYAVVFDYPSSSFGSGLPNGTYYGITPSPQPLPAYTFGPPNNINGGVVFTVGQLNVVPEPSTMVLIATGMGVLVIRRRRK